MPKFQRLNLAKGFPLSWATKVDGMVYLSGQCPKLHGSAFLNPGIFNDWNGMEWLYCHQLWCFCDQFVRNMSLVFFWFITTVVEKKQWKTQAPLLSLAVLRDSRYGHGHGKVGFGRCAK